jgi:biopolymer transport protein ExbD
MPKVSLLLRASAKFSPLPAPIWPWRGSDETEKVEKAIESVTGSGSGRAASLAPAAAIGLFAPAALAALAALAACATPAPPLTVAVHDVGGQCRYEADGRTLTLDSLLRAGRRWSGRSISVRADGNAPYRCIGAAIFALQRAGAARVGFIAEPPPPDADAPDPR